MHGISACSSCDWGSGWEGAVWQVQFESVESKIWQRVSCKILLLNCANPPGYPLLTGGGQVDPTCVWFCRKIWSAARAYSRFWEHNSATQLLLWFHQYKLTLRDRFCQSRKVKISTCLFIALNMHGILMVIQSKNNYTWVINRNILCKKESSL